MYGLKNGLASQLGIDAGKVHAMSPFVGGAFGSKGAMTPRTALIAAAAQRIGRPVRLVATRDQGFTVSTYRAETRHHVRLGATRDGKITALGHDGLEVTSRPDGYLVGGTETTARLYDIANVATNVSVVRADRSTPGFMRSPPELPYIYALESAMDELAVALNMDPVELRRINDTMVERIDGLPYSSRALVPCFEQAAAKFEWSKRDPKPMSMRDGDWLIGYGCATACYPSQFAPATARVKLSEDGRVVVSTATHEIGNGAYTVMAQIASERLGVPLENVTMQLGDSDLPAAPVAGGSITTGSVASAVAMACDKIREELGAPGGDILAAMKAKNRGVIENLAEWVPNGSKPGALSTLYKGGAPIVGGTKNKDKIMFAFGAEFVEVRVHARTREIRVPRIVGAFAAGHIVNPRTARSQLMGGMIWGISSALHEATEIDKRTAGYVNRDLAEYLVPVNADIGSVDVIFVPEQDTDVNPLGIKGLGELGNVGTAAAVANAVYHATGTRIRDLPIRLDALLI
jgi:xanthine dehydrogenase YagR molybdenum-binding subunit